MIKLLVLLCFIFQLSSHLFAGDMSISCSDRSDLSSDKMSLLPIMTKQLSLDNNFIVSSLRCLDGRDSFQVNNPNEIEIICNECNKIGQITFKIIPDKNVPSKIIWGQAKILKRLSVLTAQKDISLHQDRLSQEDFSFNEIYTDEPEHYFTDLGAIKFYKVNKSITKNQPIRNNDLIPQVLIRPGSPIKLIVTVNGIQITSAAIARERGSFRQNITIKQDKAKKDIIGEVIDFNTVLVNL